MSSFQLIQHSVAPSQRSLWGRTIWLHPRETIREIVATNPQAGVGTLVYWATITFVIDAAYTDELFLLIGLPLALLVIGPLACTIGIGIRCGLLDIVSSIFGSTADRDKIRAAYAWPKLLHIWRLPVSLALTLLSYFPSGMETLSVQDSAILLLLLIDLVIQVWAFVLLVACVSEVCHFSTWRGFLSIVLSDPIVLLGLLLTLVTTFWYVLESAGI
ncbi:MAG: hypothetical protein U0175_11415 [Caldilineaceae bacterium]